MIVPMKKAYVVVQEHNSRSMLRDLRKAGLLHIVTETVQNEQLESLAKAYDRMSQTRSVIADLQDKKQKIGQQAVSDEAFAEILERYTGLLDSRKEHEQNLVHFKSQAEVLKGWGDFDPEDLRYLRQKGLELFFYTIGKKDLAKLDASISYIQLAPVAGMEAIATIGSPLPAEVSASQLHVPEYGLNALLERIKQTESALASIQDSLRQGGTYLDAFSHQMKRMEMAMRFEQVGAHLEGGEDLAWIEGYLPEPKSEAFMSYAQDHGWAYLLEPVGEEDNPPTLVEYRKGFGIIKPVFDILGTVPGYRENDISTWFLLFFTLFFAMIIGDAGYGLVFLLAAIGLHAKARKANTLVMLIYVLSIATIVWGSLTGTWFGSKQILLSLPLLQSLVIPSISNYPELFGLTAVESQNQVMELCFIIGTIQLSLACILNVVHKIREKNLSFLADIGWLIDILALYFVVLQLVVGQPTNISVVFALVGLGFMLVVVFGAQGPGISFGKGLASGLGGFFTTFLNTISAFSNIMSYIRLFAVGMASVAIAQSFNSMAGGMMSGFAMVAGILVLVIGHSLNLVMGLLSVVVHGVRLNLLEFSGQLGMEWTGIAYEPFAQTVEEN
ncbi:V-type ATP synthase subunit I [Sphaerochaeta sp.]|uniref:V-type ATP synthase subunit I n=1 Tax=Sphaerochaeta sp. TaxID=1972642 RepID=UPI003D09826C